MSWVIIQNELKRVWHSPIAWVLFALALFVLGLLLLFLLSNFYSEIQGKLAGLERAPGLTDLVIAPYLFWVAIVGALIIPLFAVRSCTEERQQGASLLLTSAPLSIVQIVLAKFFALALLVVCFIIVCGSYALVLGYFTPIDYGKIAAACVGIFLFLCSLCASALFIANLTRTPIIATTAILALLLGLFLLYMSGSATTSSSELFLYLSSYTHLFSMLSGSIDTTHIAYFILFIILFLSLCVWKLSNRHAL